MISYAHLEELHIEDSIEFGNTQQHRELHTEVPIESGE